MTNLEYLEDSYKFESFWKVIDIWVDSFWEYIVLDKTIFYPQWGGQPSDIWEIKNEKWIFRVKKAMFNDTKEKVLHYWSFTEWSISIWDEVNLLLDSTIRIINIKNHSAWHLIDIAIENLWIKSLLPTKWHHFPDWCYVEYSWYLNIEQEKFKNDLENELKNLISKKIKVVSNNSDLNNRIVTYGWYNPWRCSWTHVKDTSEICSIKIVKIKEKQRKVKISYKT